MNMTITARPNLTITRNGPLGDEVLDIGEDVTTDAWIAREGDAWTLYVQDERGVNNAYPLTPGRIATLQAALAYIPTAGGAP